MLLSILTMEMPPLQMPGEDSDSVDSEESYASGDPRKYYSTSGTKPWDVSRVSTPCFVSILTVAMTSATESLMCCVILHLSLPLRQSRLKVSPHVMSFITARKSNNSSAANKSTNSGHNSRKSSGSNKSHNRQRTQQLEHHCMVTVNGSHGRSVITLGGWQL